MLHTPGPWKVIPGVYDCNPETASEFPHGPEIIGNGKHIASLYLHAEEDARLIAAAPDLLAVCKLVVADHEELSPHLVGRPLNVANSTIEAARAALAKAAGE